MGSVEVLTVGRKTMVGQDGQHIHTWREGALHGPSRASVSCFKMQSETVDFSDLYDLFSLYVLATLLNITNMRTLEKAGLGPSDVEGEDSFYYQFFLLFN